MNDVYFLQVELLNNIGINHGWFTRYGGVSAGKYSSLNGKKGMDDPDDNVIKNRKRAVRGLLKGSTRELSHIIHNFEDSILTINKAGEFIGYDASITTNNKVVLSQTTADCATIILASVDGEVIGLVHGSWHTLAKEIICKTVAKMKSHTSSEIVAGIGPMICKNCYEFGPEAKRIFKSEYIQAYNKKFKVDLKKMVIDQLYISGVSRIEDVNVCTYEDDRFFSARRNGSLSGRFITLASI
ncbi:polyphenol oxidase family protein [Candidatus Nomurabacteria bacterium]|nr:polyphenol oxidase family protein [Candidatus Nomurabacteria bacterium]